MASSSKTSFITGAGVHREPLQHSSPHDITSDFLVNGGISTVGIDEEAPLLADGRQRSGVTITAEYDNGINEPEWFGYAELRGIPWWKRPSVPISLLLARRHHLTPVDILAATAIPSFYHRIRRHHSPKT